MITQLAKKIFVPNKKNKEKVFAKKRMDIKFLNLELGAVDREGKRSTRLLKFATPPNSERI